MGISATFCRDCYLQRLFSTPPPPSPPPTQQGASAKVAMLLETAVWLNAHMLPGNEPIFEIRCAEVCFRFCLIVVDVTVALAAVAPLPSPCVSPVVLCSNNLFVLWPGIRGAMGCRWKRLHRLCGAPNRYVVWVDKFSVQANQLGTLVNDDV